MIKENLHSLISTIPSHVKVVAVSKTKPIELINDAFLAGQKDFGENYVQELVDKHSQLPKDIHWHFIGHLQSNKVKYIAPFVYLIHGIDSFKLLKEINKQALKNNRIINCLLQMHIAKEETKFGLSETELIELIHSNEMLTLKNIKIKGLMGMASNTDDENIIKTEFSFINNQFQKLKSIALENFEIDTLSIGMSSDYKLAIENGSTMVRIGSLIFGERN